jgi:Putative prokaryotic signal transducing protein
VSMVQLAIAGDLTEAEEIQTILRTAGIESELQPAVEQHPGALDDVPTQVLVPERSLEAAQNAIEALTEPDEIVGDR